MLTQMQQTQKGMPSLFIQSIKSASIIALSTLSIGAAATSSLALSNAGVDASAVDVKTLALLTEASAAKTELKSKLALLVSYSANFSQSISDITGKELQNSSGKLNLKIPNMLRWETQLPDETLLIADGTTVWNVDPFVEQVTVMQQSSITQNNPLMLLVSDDDQQWDAVTVDKQSTRFIVTSKDENANIVSLTIEFNGDVLSRLQSTDRQQQKSLLVFSNIAQNQSVDSSLFSFEISDNYIIDDQRGK